MIKKICEGILLCMNRNQEMSLYLIEAHTGVRASQGQSDQREKFIFPATNNYGWKQPQFNNCMFLVWVAVL